MSIFDFGSLVAGNWEEEGAQFVTRNPARPTEVVGTYRGSTEEQHIRAGVAAARAQAEWRKVPAAERHGIATSFLRQVEKRSEDIARAVTLEQGKPLAEARNETAKALGEATMMGAHMLAKGAGTEAVIAARPSFRNLVARRPRGVIAAITPWNFPILTPMRKIAPALFFGNAIIIKPSEFTPAAVCIIGEVAVETLPPGLLQILLGDGTVGASLVRLPQVAGVTFTGSVATGRKIYTLGADNLAELSLELGGKNAALVNDVSDMEDCLDQIAGAAFMCAGQRCTAISRVIVAAHLREEVEIGLRRRAEALRHGDGMIEGTTLGPLVNAAQFGRVSSMVEAGISEGARPVAGGRPLVSDPEKDGYFYASTVLADVTPDMSVARQEIFGPVIGVSSYRSLDEAFAILNGVDYGLTASVFTGDLSVMERFVSECESGMIHVNHGTIPDNHMPFGGIKNSGVGAYSVGASAASFYTTEHSIYLRAQ